MKFYVVNLGSAPQLRNQERIAQALHAEIDLEDALGYGSMTPSNWVSAWGAFKALSDGNPIAIILPQSPEVAVQAVISYKEYFGDWPTVVEVYPGAVKVVDYQERYHPTIEEVGHATL